MGSPFEKATMKMSKGFTKQDDCITLPASKLSMYGERGEPRGGLLSSASLA